MIPSWRSPMRWPGIWRHRPSEDTERMSVELDRLLGRLADEQRLLTGYSGGADSALLAYAAHQVLGSQAIAVTAVSASLPSRERRSARDFAREHAMAHVEVGAQGHRGVHH